MNLLKSVEISLKKTLKSKNDKVLLDIANGRKPEYLGQFYYNNIKVGSPFDRSGGVR